MGRTRLYTDMAWKWFTFPPLSWLLFFLVIGIYGLFDMEVFKEMFYLFAEWSMLLAFQVEADVSADVCFALTWNFSTLLLFVFPT